MQSSPFRMNPKSVKNYPSELDPAIIDEIVESVQRLKYGEVVVTVHNSKVVQIEKKEKKRFA